jgi:signal transduction histidine kinase
MRIQTRLFLGTAVLVLALMVAQWWLYARQIQAIERQVGEVATTVGANLLSGPAHVVIEGAGAPPGLLWVADGPGVDAKLISEDAAPSVSGTTMVEVIVLADEDDGSDQVVRRRITRQLLPSVSTRASSEHTQESEMTVQSFPASGVAHVDGGGGDGAASEDTVHRIELKVEPGEGRLERFLVVKSSPDAEAARIPIPVSPAVEAFSGVLRQGLAVGVGLLCVGLVAAGVLSERVTSPLRRLADGAEAIGRGDLGVQVGGRAGGEIGELQRAFNLMSRRLAELEGEREAWRQREHLAQLGDLARGLAHTVRNPLNTLGLAVEELATRERDGRIAPDHDTLVSTARTQIRRIDRWLRSFLAVGAGSAATAEDCDLAGLVQEVVLEAVQQGADIRLEAAGELPAVLVVPGAMRAALANLIENAVQCSPPDTAVDVAVAADDGEVRVSIRDHGPGLPAEVQERLFSPHVSTRAEGAGMGLFLARQLVVGMNGGALRLEDAPGGGTVATVAVPATEGGGAVDAG